MRASSKVLKKLSEIQFHPDKMSMYLPSVRLGAGKQFSVSDFDFAAAFDLYLLFENRQSYYLNLGRMSIEPHLGSRSNL